MTKERVLNFQGIGYGEYGGGSKTLNFINDERIIQIRGRAGL